MSIEQENLKYNLWLIITLFQGCLKYHCLEKDLPSEKLQPTVVLLVTVVATVPTGLTIAGQTTF